MTIDKINMDFQAIEKIIKPQTAQGSGTVKAQDGKGSFAEMLNGAMKEVDALQKDADKQIEGLMLGSDNVSPHGAMIALEKADMAFQMMNTIRSKIIRAYEEVIRTQV